MSETRYILCTEAEAQGVLSRSTSRWFEQLRPLNGGFIVEFAGDVPTELQDGRPVMQASEVRDVIADVEADGTFEGAGMAAVLSAALQSWFAQLMQ